MIHTASYFNMVDHVGKVYGISSSMPKGFVPDGRLLSFIPDYKLVRDYKDSVITWQEYEKIYISTMDSVDHEDDFGVMRGSEPCTLLCWERTVGRCHRRLLGEWLGKLGWEVDIK